ncbi:photosystem I reaction center subunit XII [Synechococcus sp. MIT S9503]
MESSLTNLEICIALIIAINVAVLALRLCVSLYKA